LYLQLVVDDPLEAARSIASQCLALRVRRLDRQLTRIYDEALRPLGMTGAQFHLLVAIAVAAPVTPASLVSVMELEKSTLSRNVAKMVEHGWVRSTPGSAGGLELSATPKGLRLIAKAYPMWQQTQARVRDLLDDDLAASLAALPPHAPPRARR
jgi:DNA-binding MarR family transcriptional regulator